MSANKTAILKEFDWLIRTAMYAIAGCAFIAIGSTALIFIGTLLIVLALFYSNLVISTKLRDDIMKKIDEKTAN
jgi:hypothetical protein